MTAAVTPPDEAPAIARAPSAPFLLPFDPDLVRANFPADLRSLRQWVFWNLEHPRGKKKPTKVPYSSRGAHAKTTVPETWCSLEEALAARLRGIPGGVGFVFAGSGQVGIDLDHCRDAATGAIDPWAKAILDALSSYSEVSPSGTGVHVLVRGALPGAGRKRYVRAEGAHPEAAVEVYDRGRYFTVTGRRMPVYPAALEDRQEAVERLYASMAEKPKKASATVPATPSTALPDDEVLRHAFAAKNGPAFLRLWNGDISGHGDDDSAADLALCGHLAFWCRGDPAQMDRLFRRSKLYREKWDRKDYRDRTLAKALEGRTEFYEPRHGAPQTQTVKESWPAPSPMPPLEVETPALPADLLPSGLRPWLEDAAERISVPLEFVAMPGLVALGSVVGRGCGIQPKKRDDWLVVPNLWGAIAAGPGRMKTASANEGIRFLKRLAAEATKEYLARAEKEKRTLEVLDARRAGLKERVKKLARDGRDASGVEEELADLDAKIAECRRPERRYHIADATVAKLGALLAENPRGLCLIRDEVAGLFLGMTRSGCEGDREFYLEAWNGTGSFVVDRIGRGTVHIPALTLSVFGSIQPGKLQAFIDEATMPGIGADGLLQRLQLLVWPGDLGPFKNVDRYPNAVAREAAFRVFQRLAGDIPAPEKDEDTGIPFLRFAPDAQELFDAWRGELETRLRAQEMENTPAFAAHLAKYRSLVPALALLFHLAEAAPAGQTYDPVPLTAVQRAAALVEYLEAHARRVYAVEVQREANAAHELLRHAREGHIESGVTVRDLGKRGWSGLSTPETVVKALQALQDHGWVRVIEDRGRSHGGRPSKRVLLHPELRGSA